MPRYSIPASQVGHIMTEPKNKTDKDAGLLSKGAKSFLDQMALDKFYDIKDPLRTKETMKGEECEDEAITMIQRRIGGLLEKNEEKYGGPPQHFSGYPDILEEESGETVIDAKVPFDIFSFLKAEPPVTPTGKLTVYGYQLQAYMELTGRDFSCLVYCLIDTPQHILDDILYREQFKFENGDSHPLWEAHKYAIKRKHRFDDDDIPEEDRIPYEKRVKLFRINRDQKVIDSMKERAEKASEYLENWSMV